jgi:hypothetical protein
VTRRFGFKSGSKRGADLRLKLLQNDVRLLNFGLGDVGEAIDDVLKKKKIRLL